MATLPIVLLMCVLAGGALLIALLARQRSAGLVIAYAALHVIVRRPRTGEDRVVDDARRKRSARVVTGATGILFALPLAGVSATAAAALTGIDCAPTWWHSAGYGLTALVPASLIMVAWCAAAVLTPADRGDLPAHAR